MIKEGDHIHPCSYYLYHLYLSMLPRISDVPSGVAVVQDIISTRAYHKKLLPSTQGVGITVSCPVLNHLLHKTNNRFNIMESQISKFLSQGEQISLDNDQYNIGYKKNRSRTHFWHALSTVYQLGIWL